jgi:hypothetical protein
MAMTPMLTSGRRRHSSINAWRGTNRTRLLSAAMAEAT